VVGQEYAALVQSEFARTPLFIWDPRAGRQAVAVDSLAQMPDLWPPRCSISLACRCPADHARGAPGRRRLQSGAPTHEAVLFGVYGGHVNVTDGRYVYMRCPGHTREHGPALRVYPHAHPDAPALYGGRNAGGRTSAAASPLPKEMAAAQSAQPGSRSRPINLAPSSSIWQADPQQEHPLQDAAIEARMIRSAGPPHAEPTTAPPEQFVRLGLEGYVNATA
jgi:hypothetical protein